MSVVEQLAHGVDLGPLEAVAGPLGQVELFDGQVEVGGADGSGAALAQLDAGSELYSPSGTLRALSRQTWITLADGAVTR